MRLTAPEPLADHHRLDDFDSGVSSLDDWLRRRALPNQLSGASRVFVLADGESRVLAYYALASGSVASTEASGAFRRNMPDPIPVVILGRLAIDRSLQGKGYGRGLIRDAAKRVVAAADAIGVRGLLVHAISEEAKAFYLALGFQESPAQPMMLMVTLKALREHL